MPTRSPSGRDQIRAVVSMLPAAASSVSSGLNARSVVLPVVGIDPLAWPVPASQSRTKRSDPPVATNLPSWLNRALLTSTTLVSFRTSPRPSTVKIRAYLSPPTVSKREPSGLKATIRTSSPRAPRSCGSSGDSSSPPATFQTRALPSAHPVAIKRPLGEKSSDSTLAGC